MYSCTILFRVSLTRVVEIDLTRMMRGVVAVSTAFALVAGWSATSASAAAVPVRGSVNWWKFENADCGYDDIFGHGDCQGSTVDQCKQKCIGVSHRRWGEEWSGSIPTRCHTVPRGTTGHWRAHDSHILLAAAIVTIVTPFSDPNRLLAWLLGYGCV